MAHDAKARRRRIAYARRQFCGRGGALALAGAIAAFPVFAHGQTTYDWTGADGTSGWSDANNWSPAVVPGATGTAGATASIITSNVASVYYDFTPVPGPAALSAVNVDYTPGGGLANTLNLLGSNLSIVASNEDVGITGGGAINQTAGINLASFALNLGESSDSTGVYSLGGTGTLSVTGLETVGVSGIGSFNQSSGSNTAGATASTSPGDLLIAALPGSIGTYSLTGGSLVTSAIELGGEGVGLFDQTGGTVTIANPPRVSRNTLLELGYAIGSTGTYVLSGSGSLSVPKGDEWIGNNGVGLFEQTGGENTVEYLSVGSWGIEGSSYTLSGGTLFVTTSEQVGFGGGQGTGSFLQSGGFNTAAMVQVGSPLRVSGAASVSFSLSGGELSTPDLAIDDGGTFDWSGGSLVANTVSLSGGTYVTPGALGNTFDWNSGTLVMMNNLTVGEGGVLGPSVNLSTGFGLGVQGAGSTLTITGAVTVDGGLLEATAISNQGTITWTSGEFDLTGTDLTVGGGGLLGPTLTLGPNQTLGVIGPGNVLDITGALSIAGGTLNAAAINNSGSLTWTSGTLNLTNSDLLVGVGGLLGANVTLVAGQTLAVTGPNNLLDLTGTLNLNGGAVIVSAFNNVGTLNWATGTLGFMNGLTVGPGGPLGASVALTAGQTLEVTNPAGTLNVTGTLTVSGGNVSAPALNLAGAMNMNAGEISAGTFNNQGMFDWSGGTVMLTNNNVTVGPGGLFGADLTLAPGQALELTNLNNSLNISGTLNLNGGTLIAPSLTYSGAINWNSGAFILTNSNFYVGTGGLLGPSLTLNSGQTLALTSSVNTLMVTGTLTSSGASIRAGIEEIGDGNEDAVFNQSGGLNTAASLALNAVQIVYPFLPGFPYPPPPPPVYNLSGGILALGQLTGNGVLNWTGGTLEFTQSQTFSSFGYNSSNLGSQFSVGAGQEFIVNGNALLGNSFLIPLAPAAISLSAGSTAVVSGALIVNQDSSVTQSGGDLTVDGSFTLSGGNAEIDGLLNTAGVNVFAGTLKGTGTINGPIFNTGGTVAPGDSPGQLTVTGNYTQSAGGTFDVLLGGYAPGTQFSQLLVSGSALLAGTIEVDLTNGFYPVVGDQFTFLTAAGGVTGGFTTYTSNTGDFGYTLNYGSGNIVEITVTVIPEPVSLGLFAAAFVLLARRRRRFRLGE